MPSIGQTRVLASIGAVVEMGILSTLKRLLMESRYHVASCGVWFLWLHLAQSYKVKTEMVEKTGHFF
jgi:hypothetical protein